jgi:hypothetical protein
MNWASPLWGTLSKEGSKYLDPATTSFSLRDVAGVRIYLLELRQTCPKLDQWWNSHRFWTKEIRENGSSSLHRGVC